MKKLILVTLAIMGFLFYTTNVSAQTKQATEKTVAKTEQTTTQGKYVDKNNNGVCDKHEGKGEKCKDTKCGDKKGNAGCDKNAEKCKASANCKAASSGNAHQCGQTKGNGNCNGAQKRDGSCCPQKK